MISSSMAKMVVACSVIHTRSESELVDEYRETDDNARDDSKD